MDEGRPYFLAKNDFFMIIVIVGHTNMFCLFYFISETGIKWRKLLGVDCCVASDGGVDLNEGGRIFDKKCIFIMELFAATA